MPVLFQKIIRREDLRRNPQVLYVFGDNMLRKGLGGLAAICRFEKNAVGVVTKYLPSMAPDAFFTDDAVGVLAQNRQIDKDMKPLFAHVKHGGIVVWPTDGIGTNLADLQERAPRTFDHVQSKLAALIRVGKLFEQGKLDGAKREAQEHL